MFVVGVGDPAYLDKADIIVPDLTAVDLESLL
jgi:hypothetical protein